jgi:hypothetical protein
LPPNPSPLRMSHLDSLDNSPVSGGPGRASLHIASTSRSATGRRHPSME